MNECTHHLNNSVASLSIELLDWALADPSHLPLKSVSNSSKLSWENVLTMNSRDFMDKYAHFVITTAALLMAVDEDLTKLRIDRATVLEESIESLSVIPTEFIHALLGIRFNYEAGRDAGGLHREWFVLLNESLVDPSCGVFRCLNKDEQT
ncbi:Nedd4 e3 ubiquitin-protein ligase wwp1 [Globisporangium polare]